MARVKTGIKDLDPLIGGGFKQNSVNLVVGMPGSGKSIFAAQFILQGIKEGEAGVYITFEEKRSKFLDDMKDFGWDFADYEAKKKFTLLEYTPEQVKKMLTEGGGIVENIIEKTKAKRVAIDSITSFALLYSDELTRREASLALFELIANWNTTALLTSQGAGESSDIVEAAMEFEADSIIFMHHTRKKSERVRALEILKMRGTRIPEKIFPLSIEKDGLKIDAKKTVEI
jgi:circadian clock protein KaiC